MSNEKVIILYDSPEAAQYVTNIEGWISRERHFYGKGEFGERSARQDGCTHKKCEVCGKVFEKTWSSCPDCQRTARYERFKKLEYKEWDGVEFICVYDGDEYFWDLESLQEYMCENDLDDIDLYICTPIFYNTIDSETVAGDAHEDWEPTTELENKIKEFNDYIKTLNPHSWSPGKIRTSYKLPEDVKAEYNS